MNPDPTAATQEIFAYLAVRDQALVQAEENLSEETMQRATMANEFATSCLQRPRTPYQAQCLEESDARRERQRCATVATRLAQLQARMSERSHEPALAA